MTLVRYNPHSMLDEFDSFFDNDFQPMSFRRKPFSLWKSLYDSPSSGDDLRYLDPSANVYETDTEWVYMFEMPGVKESDLKVECDSGYLKIIGEKKYETDHGFKGYHRREICEGRVEKSIRLHEGSDVESIKASLKDGLLKILVPKNESLKAKLIDVETV